MPCPLSPLSSPPLPLSGLPVRWGAVAARLAAACVVVAVCAVLPTQAWQSAPMLEAAGRLGPRAQAAVPALQAMLTALAQAPDADRLHQVNGFFNRQLAFRTDAEVWGRDDYWASPLEALSRGAGDCEDYAIAKYLSLVSSGMNVAHLRLVYVRARLGTPGEPAVGQPHMVLAYYAQPQDDPLILDNLVPEIEPASRRRDLTPVFSFNSEGLWQGVGASQAGDPLARLSRWRAVLQKGHEEGFL